MRTSPEFPLWSSKYRCSLIISRKGERFIFKKRMQIEQLCSPYLTKVVCKEKTICIG